MHQLDRIEEMLLRITGDITPNTMQKSEVRDLTMALIGGLQHGLLIESIKAYRRLTGLSLKDSKDVIVSLWVSLGKEYPRADL